jgi:octaprenyl-diphosphate synthase
MKSELRRIKAPIDEEFQKFEGHFREAMRSKVPLLDRITYYIVKRKGKQLRPIFVFLSAKLAGEVNERTYVAASLVELLHTATLVHDDVVDDAYRRRGFFSINALWKNKIAVLVGDYLLSRGLLLAVENEQYKLLEILSAAVKEMSEGELLQIEKARRLDIEEPIYFEIIRQKTASLIAAACAAGAASATANGQAVERLHALGEHVGIAFQIKDDLFDYEKSDIGKPRGIDIKEKKMTLPLIYALRHADKVTKSRIIRIIRKHSNKKDKVREVIKFVEASGGIEYASKKMETYRDGALDILETFPGCDAVDSMRQLIHFVTARRT